MTTISAPYTFWRKALGFTATAIGMIVGVLAVLRYFDTVLNQHLSGPLALLSPMYDALIQGLAKKLQPPIKELLRLINEWWSWQLELPPGWEYILVPPWVYFTEVSSANFEMRQTARYFHGFAIFIVGGIVSLAICIAAGTTNPGSNWRLLYTIACFTAFDLLALIFFVVLVDNGFNWRNNVRWQFWTHVPGTLVAGVLVLLLHHVWSNWGVERLDVTLIMGFIALLGARDLGIALYASITSPKPGMTTWERLTSQGNYRLGRLVLGITLGSAIYAFLFPATSNP
jgi:hypothetical protein